MVDYIALAVPFFFLLIAIELGVAWRKGRRVYRFADAIADLGCGVTQRIALLAFDVLLGVAYVWIYRNARLFDLTHALLTAVVALLGADLAYYWWHRLSHRVNFLWAAHVVHHQSEDYNLAVALRQSVFTPLTAMPFALPFALLGVPPLAYGLAGAVSTLYQFWIHTELVGKLGPLEAVFNTPSHHRVHHARNSAYLDRNYGAIFIFWDRLFGTFAREEEKPRYGITKPLRSFNAIWAQVQPLADLAADARAAPSWRERLTVWLAPPERVFPWRLPASAHEGHDVRYDVPVSRGLKRYVLVHFALAVVATFLLMMWARALPVGWRAACAVLVLATVLAMAGLMERKSWARPLEALRVAGALVVAVLFLR